MTKKQKPPAVIAGIDLGTTNSALAYAAAPDAAVRDLPAVTPFEIPQLARPNDFRPLPLLPSCLFLHGEADFPTGSVALPWDDNPAFVTGELARTRGAEVPSRLIVSAKSWLSHSAVDRSAALLPLEAPDGVKRISPVEASRRYLEHLRLAWNHANPDTPLEAQTVLVTVPASFDAVARDLTLRAASEAGLRDVVLLEEPQAAFYAWIERHPDWRQRVGPGALVLVIDVGGGTTDFSLIAVTEQSGDLALERVAVGEHILLGGDNMDLALAHSVAASLEGKKLSTTQMTGLWQSCRAAKETLFADPARSDFPVTVLGRGSGVVGGAIKAKVERALLDSIVLEGFFPEASLDDAPHEPRQTGINEIGLPYAMDAAVTRHLARFLRQAGNLGGKGSAAAPTHVLFNGGVFLAAPLRDRLMRILNGWLAAQGLGEAVALEGDDLMHAVSRGAVYYGLVRAGHGIRIRGGIARSYYIGIQPSMPAIPGVRPPLKALTVAQLGMEEGSRAQAGRREFALRVGVPADFRFFSSVERRDDEPGTMVEDLTGDMEELTPIEVTLSGGEAETVPVTLETEITETGLLQLWCVARDGRRWKLEFNVREKLSS